MIGVPEKVNQGDEASRLPREGWPNLIEQLSRSVVTVHAAKKPEKNADLVDPLNPEKIQEPIFLPVWEGTGFFVSNDGYIMTNAHLVSDPKAEYNVTFADGRRVRAKVAYVHPLFQAATPTEKDIALLKIEGSGYPIVTLGDSSKIRKGDPALLIGNPLNFDGSAATGIISNPPSVSSPEDNKTDKENKGLIKIDNMGHAGSSGSPLFNSLGEVVGINFASEADESNHTGSMGLAIPINEIKTLLRYKEVFIGAKEIFADALAARSREDSPEALQPVFVRTINMVVALIARSVPEQELAFAKKQIGVDSGMIANFQAILMTVSPKHPIRKPEIYTNLYQDAFGTALDMSGVPVADIPVADVSAVDQTGK